MNLLSVPDAELYYDAHFLAPDEANELFQLFRDRCAWKRHKTSFMHPVPRDEAYYGDAGSHYTYSRREYQPLPWLAELLALKTRVEKATPLEAYSNLGLPNVGYNAVLCNLYRNGNDSVGLHADAEPEMGPVIASISLGAERLFRLKRKDGKVAFAEKLPHGSLVIMAGKTQAKFKHEVPKQPDITQPRINLTFRRIDHK
jgi:alkylated DNA repair dioxygenase AlkB